MGMKQDRLSSRKWVEAGLSALVKQGPSALRAEPLARALGTTKGSFYWHFADVPAFHTAVLDHWQAQAFADIVSALEKPGSAADRLRVFGALVLKDSAGAAIRAWAQGHTGAANSIAQVDAQRLQYVQTLLASVGVTNADFTLAAYGSLIGMPHVPGHNRAEAEGAYASLVDLVLALR